jgi:hypothetical protein
MCMLIRSSMHHGSSSITFNSFRRFSSSRNMNKIFYYIVESFVLLPASRIQRSRFSLRYSTHGRRRVVDRAIGVVIDDGFLSRLLI